jgi:hypothetical protein
VTLESVRRELWHAGTPTKLTELGRGRATLFDDRVEMGRTVIELVPDLLVDVSMGAGGGYLTVSGPDGQKSVKLRSAEETEARAFAAAVRAAAQRVGEVHAERARKVQALEARLAELVGPQEQAERPVDEPAPGEAEPVVLPPGPRAPLEPAVVSGDEPVVVTSIPAPAAAAVARPVREQRRRDRQDREARAATARQPRRRARSGSTPAARPSRPRMSRLRMPRVAMPGLGPPRLRMPRFRPRAGLPSWVVGLLVAAVAVSLVAATGYVAANHVRTSPAAGDPASAVPAPHSQAPPPAGDPGAGPTAGSPVGPAAERTRAAKLRRQLKGRFKVVNLTWENDVLVARLRSGDPGAFFELVHASGLDPDQAVLEDYAAIDGSTELIAVYSLSRAQAQRLNWKESAKIRWDDFLTYRRPS